MDDASEWKRPSEIMKLRRKRKSVTQKKIVPGDEEKHNFIYRSPTSKKRKNPFLCSQSTGPNKRQMIDNKENSQSKTDSNRDSTSALFNILDKTNKDQVAIPQAIKQETVQQRPDIENHFPVAQGRGTGETDEKTEPPTKSKHQRVASENDMSSSVPLDWCLKTKLRVVSSHSLQWCVQLRSSEEAHGINSYVQNSEEEIDSMAGRQREFHRSGMYWIHPNLPWTRLFPRIIDDSKASKFNSLLLQEDVQSSIHTDWEESFTSAFYQLRSGLCPYFYLCTHIFTVLFLGEAAGQSKLVAMVTPSTRGFRESLESEGIEFRLPVAEKRQTYGKENITESEQSSKSELHQKSSMSDTSPDAGTPCKHVDVKPEEDEDEEDVMATDEGASGWLESIGLDKKEFPSLDPRKVKLQREGFRAIDHRPESLVWVEGADVQALFNFLLNCRTCTATSGAQAGVPPTILSPAPFRGASLKSHKKKHTVVKQVDRDGNISHAHILEITGPVLPQHTCSLVSLFHRTQEADFGLAFSNHDPTVPFNILLHSQMYRKQKDKSPGAHEISSKIVARSSENEMDVETSKISVGNRCLDSGSCESDTVSEANNVKSEQSSMCLLENTDSEGKTSSSVSVLPGKNSEALSKRCAVKDWASLAVSSKLFESKPVADRVCGIKELVCLPGGFTWTT